MPTDRPIIFLIDDDDSVRRALGRVMTSAGFESRAFSTAENFLEAVLPDRRCPSCVVTDMTLPGLSGLELKLQLNTRQTGIPVIFLTANDTAEMRAAAHQAGAAGFFRKPVDTQALIDAIQWAFNPAPSRPASLFFAQTTNP